MHHSGMLPSEKLLCYGLDTSFLDTPKPLAHCGTCLSCACVLPPRLVPPALDFHCPPCPSPHCILQKLILCSNLFSSFKNKITGRVKETQSPQSSGVTHQTPLTPALDFLLLFCFLFFSFGLVLYVCPFEIDSLSLTCTS